MPPAWRPLFTMLRLGIALGLLAWLGASGVIDWQALGGLVAAWPLALAAFLLLLMDHAVTAWRLCVLLAARGLSLSLAASLRLTLMGTFFNVCLPGALGGDVVKIYYATQGSAGRWTEVTTIMLLDRALGMVGLLLWPLLAAPLFLDLIRSQAVLVGLLWTAAGTVLVMALGLLLCSSDRFWRFGATAAVLCRGPCKDLLAPMLETIRGYRQQPMTLMVAVGISLLAHTCLVGVLLLVAAAMLPDGASWQMSMLVPLGFLANALPLTPGGLGVGEAAFNSLFGLAGLSGGAAALLGWRVLTALSGLIGLTFYLQGRHRFVYDAPLPSDSELGRLLGNRAAERA